MFVLIVKAILKSVGSNRRRSEEEVVIRPHVTPEITLQGECTLLTWTDSKSKIVKAHWV